MSENRAELNVFLSGARSLGTVDSTADFTIDTLKAQQKLSSRQFPQDGLWLVKMVQAAVAFQARGIDIKFRRNEVQFYFEGEDWPWDARRFFEDLLSSVLPSEPVLFHLFAGLRNSLFEDTVRAEWSIATTEKVFTAKFHS